MKYIIPLIIALFLPFSVPAQSKCRAGSFPSHSFDQKNVFPADKSLKRPEDGKALRDGRVVVGDDEHGLRIIEKDGKHRPFGKFKEAGFMNTLPDKPGAPNGVFLEPGGKHLLVADVYTGFIYRVDVSTEATQIIYRHEFGVNSVIRENDGTIWFTQSAENNLSTGSGALYVAINKTAPTGAVFRLEGTGFEMSGKAKKMAGEIYFANGLAIAYDRLFVAETMMDRVLVFDFEHNSDTLKNRRTYTNVLSPDNLMLDSKDNLYIASPISNSIYAVGARCESLHRIFYAPSDGNTNAQHAWTIGSRTGKPLLPALSPETYTPLPGMITGMFFSTDEKTFYITGLGNAVLRF